MHMIRTFIAVKIAVTPLLRELLTRLNFVGRGLRPTAADQIHITLKFLGDTDESLLPEIMAILTPVVSTQTACAVELHGLGVFPDEKRPTVLWAGLQNAAALIDIAGQLETDLARLGFAPERRPFKPHLTLMRLRDRPPREVFDILHKHAQTDFGSVAVQSVELYQSELLKTGPRYTVLVSAPMADL